MKPKDETYPLSQRPESTQSFDRGTAMEHGQQATQPDLPLTGGQVDEPALNPQLPRL